MSHAGTLEPLGPKIVRASESLADLAGATSERLSAFAASLSARNTPIWERSRDGEGGPVRGRGPTRIESEGFDNDDDAVRRAPERAVVVLPVAVDGDGAALHVAHLLVCG
jgi:hypothetical protein